MAEELWKTIKGYEGIYQVSNNGQVRSLNRTITDCRGRKQIIKEKILKPENVDDGYERVSLCRNGGQKHHRVATLVYEAFNGPIPKGLEIDHINGNNRDNRLENLRVCTHKENCNNPITLARNITANERRSRTLKEYWRKKKAASTT